ncbi:MAG: LLM class flavin-dependent oxidoreductase [Halieaceae bacterium]|jgi:alkanesulfonate monooxygenase SsuD/methylene tetrahydromethanopterin reductase-like flavin-dependent oxidoreductase (luciferase family)|nr:LLM class flavin-dependent oxidoreductase [Halieaceae bacterium]
MKVGLQQVFQNHGRAVPDGQMVDEEVELGLLAEELDFDELWPVEHHFTDYAACPDNTQFLSYMAARTSRIKLATGAVILPWNQPVRVAEKISLLDHLSGGRAIFGMGRGLARCEYEGMGIEMSESRERFDESAQLVLDALESGFMCNEAPVHYPQARTEIRPAPRTSFRRRIYAVGMSPDSVVAAGKLGAQILLFSNRSDESLAESVAIYRESYGQHHGTEPLPPRVCDFMYCAESTEQAGVVGHQAISNYFVSVMNHYELLGDHFPRGYQSYQEQSAALQSIGKVQACADYVAVQSCGTPQEIIQRLQARRDVIGDYELNVCARFGGLTIEEATNSLSLFGRHVLPVLRQW